MGFKEWREDRREQRTARKDEKNERLRRAWREREAHQRRLKVAAGVAGIPVVCHRDTWEFIQRYARGGTNYIAPRADDVAEIGEGMIEAQISGVQAVQYLVVMHEAVRKILTPETERPVAERVYQALARVIDTIDPDAPAEGPAPQVPAAVFDDRPRQPTREVPEG